MNLDNFDKTIQILKSSIFVKTRFGNFRQSECFYSV